MNRDFFDMLSAFSAVGAEYLIVGAYALAAHGLPRATGDLDIWVNPTPENATRVWNALRAFRAPMRKMQVEDFIAPDIVYQIGVAPNRIGLLTSISGVDFADAWKSRIEKKIDGLTVAVIGRDELQANKLASGRPKDLADAAWLSRQQ